MIQWVLICCAENAESSSSSYTDWMANLSPGLQRTPIKYLAIPGSHDSGTYSLDKADENIYVNKYTKYLQEANNISGKGALNTVVYRWSKTQNLNFSQQLLLGVRYFDIRIAMDDNGNARVVHGLFGASLESILLQIKNFLSLHQKEVVLLDISNIHRNKNEEILLENAIIRDIFNTFNSTLCKAKLVDKSLLNVWKSNCQVFFFYGPQTNKTYGGRAPYVFPKALIWSPFEYKPFAQPSQWIKFLNQTYRMPSSHFHVVQGIMQPHWVEIVAGGMSNSATLKDWVSDQASSELVKWLNGKRNGKDGVKIVIADFIEDHGFVDTVLALNTVEVSGSGTSDDINRIFITILFWFLWFLL